MHMADTEIVDNRQAAGEAIAETVGGNAGDAEIAQALRATRRSRLPAPFDLDRSGERRAHAGQRLHQLGLAVAADAGDAVDFAGADMKSSHPLTVTWPSARAACKPLTVITARRAATRRGAAERRWCRPQAASVRCAVVERESSSATARPLRITVTRSVKAVTSPSLWVTSTTAAPPAASARTVVSSRTASSSVSTAVGSSRMRMRAPASSTLMISTRCRSAIDNSSTRLLGSISKPKLGGLLLDLPLDRAHTRREPAAPIGEQHVFGDGERPHQLEFLMHHADAAGRGVARAGEHDLFAVNEDPSGVRRVEAGRHVHQRRFAGAVLAQQRMDFAGSRLELRVVEGDEIRQTIS